MKKLLVLLWMFVLVGGLVWAKADAEVVAEEGKIYEIVLAHGYASYYQQTMDRYEAETPNAKIKWVSGDAIDPLFAAGDPPNVYMKTPGGVGKYLIPGYALELNADNVGNLGDFMPEALEMYYREGALLALPVCVAVNALDINLTLAEKVGFEVPDRDFLYVDEVLDFFGLIKANAPGCYGTAIYAGNSGSQGVNVNWFSGFGATLFENGDYSHTTINSPEALAALEFIRTIIESGYAEPNSEVLDDDETLGYWARGRYGLHWSRAGGMLGMIDGAVSEGLLDEPFEHRFMSFPRARGVDKAPLTFGGAAGLVIKSGDDVEDALAAKLLSYMCGAIPQTRTIRGGGNYPTIKTAVMPAGACIGDPGCIENDRVYQIWQDNGLYDLGYTTLIFDGMMQEWLLLWQDFVVGKIEPQKFLDDWEEAINKLLDES